MRQRKNLRALLTLALALILCLGSFTAAFALGEINAADEDNPPEAAIAKVLKLPVGSENIYSGYTFAFTITPVSMDGVDDQGALDAMPELGTNNTASIQITQAEAQTAAAVTANVTNGVISVIKESGDLLSGAAFTHAGIYVYTITEDANTYTSSATGFDEDIDDSPAEYTLTLWVEKHSTNGTYYVYSLAVVIDTEDTDDQAANNKVDPTPDSGAGTDYSGMTFTNYYTATRTGTDPEDPTDTGSQALTVSAAVDGGFANEDIYFPYDIAVTAPDFLTGTLTYRAYVLDENDAVVDVDTGDDTQIGSKTGTDPTYGDYFEFTSGAAATRLNLKHGQKVVFVGLPVGSAWTVTDVLSGTDDPFKEYFAGVEFTDAIASTDTIANTSAQKGVSLTVPLSGSLYILEAGSYANFTNTRDVVTPTGILLNNLPYIGLILLAVAALALFVTVKSRRREQDEEA
jgi:hypothetical protein